MKQSRSLGLAVISLSLGACTRATNPVQTIPGTVTSSPAAILRAKADSIRLPYTAADIRFMSGMIHHHAQAIVMSGLVPTRSTDRAIRTLAERIINAQQDDIVIMQRWLRDRRQMVPDPKTGGASNAMAGHSHTAAPTSNAQSGGSHMPGMLSDAQLAQLDSARSRDFDELFITFMIQHHKGAIEMVKELLASEAGGQDETVFRFASDVNVDQTTEIARMERMLVMLKLEKKSP